MARQRGIDAEAARERIREKLARIPSAEAVSGPSDGEILRRRARELARPAPAAEAGERLEIIAFRLGPERFAFESAWVKEVFVPREIVPIPGAPPFIAGIVNLRGTLLSVTDLRKILHLPDEAQESPVVLLLSDAEMEFGVLADRIEQSEEIPLDALAPPLPAREGEGIRYFRGILPGLLSLLDGRLLLQSPHLRVDQRDASPFLNEETIS